MRILMFTNTYLPHVGGVARAVHTLASDLRSSGHAVRVVAPDFAGEKEEEGVLRVPAIQNWNGGPFSVSLPLPGLLDEPVDAFAPDLIHSHHPFLLGNTAARLAAERGLPLVFTHHTLFERYVHYLGGGSDSPALRRAARNLSGEYAGLCDGVFAPSESVARLLRRRGVKSPIAVVPTGVDLETFGSGSRARGRAALGLPPGAFVVGHVGRLAREKNLRFLGAAVAEYLRRDPSAWFLVAGAGPEEPVLRGLLNRAGAGERLRLAGLRSGTDLADAYAAMDVFAFASTSETQGLVLAEAMAAGVPVVALDAGGVREVVRDAWNGRKLERARPGDFAEALGWVREASPSQRAALRRRARATARGFSRPSCLKKALAAYGEVLRRRRETGAASAGPWQAALRRVQVEWKLLGIKASALGEVLAG